MSYNYIVTANKASAVSNSVAGNFTSPNDINLITAKLSRLEISKVTPDGLKLMREVGVYGRIEAIRLFRPPGEKKDLLFLLTSKYHVAILECIESPGSESSIDIITLRSGNIADPACRPAESGNIVIIDPACKIIGLRMHDGLFKAIPIDRNKTDDLEAFNIRMEEIVVPDIAFLYGFVNPTIGFIHREAQTGTSHVETYEIALKEKEFVIGPWQKDDVANEANIIIPVPEPFGGAIIVSNETIVYINNDQEKTIDPNLMKQSPINCYARIDKDGSRYLLGDLSGRLFCLILEADDVRLNDSKLQVKNMKLELLGEISIPECITYLDNAIVYIGSKLGDSQLIKLLTEPDENGSFLKVCETYTNLGPISDMCLVDLEKQGQGQLVTCSGHSKDGSIRIIRNGIGIHEHTIMDLEDVMRVWSLKIGKDQFEDNYIVLVLKKEDVGAPESDLTFLWHCEEDGQFNNIDSGHGFDMRQRTFLCANVAHEQIVQVTELSVRLISSIDMRLIAKFKFPNTGQETHNVLAYDNQLAVAHNNDYVVCSIRNMLYCFKIHPGKIEMFRSIALESHISCLDLTPLIPDTQLLSVGFFPQGVRDRGMELVVYSWPEINEVHREKLPISAQSNSLITAQLEDFYYLLISHGDGTVFYFKLDPLTGELTNRKKVTLGTHSTILRPFKSQSSTSIFVCSSRPTVIYSNNNKLVFSTVNLKTVENMCPLNSKAYPSSLVMIVVQDPVNVTGLQLLFGTIDEIQKLHITTIPLYESPLKITYQHSTQVFGVLSSRIDTPDINGLQPIRPSASTQAQMKSSAVAMSSATTRPVLAGQDSFELETSNLLIVDQHTFEVLHAHQFMPTEQAVSILSAHLGESREEYIVVGTAFVIDDEPEAKQGRLIVFKWSQEAKLQQIAELGIKGSAYCLCEFENGRFLAGINASVNLVELNSRGDLHIECSYASATIALYLKRKGDLILMGDLMRSLSLYTYKPVESHFEELARDLNPSWLTEVEILDEETFLGAEHQYNIFVCKRDTKSPNENDRAVLQQVGAFHLGDSVNVFHPGSLVVQHPSESSIEVKRATLFGTIDGVVGLILSIDEELFRCLEAIQNSLSKIVKSVGQIDHSEWRSFQSNKSTQRSVGFIDGDLIETFLDLSKPKMELVSKEVEMSVEELVKIIEELSRLH